MTSITWTRTKSLPFHHSAIQELSRKNDRLEAENAELKTRMDAMEAAIIALQNN